MSRVAQADALVPRASLRDPRERVALRIRLYEALAELGHVESVDRYVRDPKDGPLHDAHAGDVDFDRFAIVRIIGRVVPFA